MSPPEQGHPASSTGSPADRSITARQLTDVASRLDGRVLTRLLPGLDQADLTTIRQEFALWMAGQRRRWGSWEEAWNDFTGAAPGHPGQIRFQPSRCRECRGRRLDLRRGRVCLACVGTGRHRGTASTLALSATPPAAPTAGG